MSSENTTLDKNISIINIENEMRGAYLDYAMSVIIGRALPDVRDGLKPVHRRVLYAMYDLGNTYSKPYKKSARVVGDVIGKYHPHGDFAVYDAIVRMAQDFSMRYPLVDGQGNFGSVDGDAAAAMRYTEIRMERITDELLADLEKETVDYGPNYDDSLQEPLVFPAKFPNLLVNGSAGIAVGMATNIPPHNLNEVMDAAIALVANPSLETRDLFQYVKGPDFPTAGFIVESGNLRKAYETGRGVITLRGKAEIEVGANDRERIVITELPYQLNKARMIEKIADLVRDKKIEGISDLRDESDRDGIRVVIDIKRGENSNVILNRLYKLTQFQESFGISLLAIHHNQPKVFNLRDMIWAFIEHRKDVVFRRTAFDLRKAEAKAHILEGLKRAVENVDEVINLIKASKGPDEARASLIKKFEFSEKQAQAILDMRLQRLTGLERDKIVQEYNETIQLIGELKAILGSEKRVFEIIVEELKTIKEKYGTERKTQILRDESAEFDDEDLIADTETLVTMTHRGYVKRTDPKLFRSQNRGGKGQKAITTSDDDFVSAIYSTSTRTTLLCFTDTGRVFSLKVYQIPEASKIAKGKAIVNLLKLSPNESVRAVLPIKDFAENVFIVMVSRRGIIKKTALSDFKNIRVSGLNAMSVRDDDSLLDAKLSHGSQQILICTSGGKSIRFEEEHVRPMGRTARGVKAVNFGDSDGSDEEGVTVSTANVAETDEESSNVVSDSDDCVVSMEILDPHAEKDTTVLTVTQLGYGKRTPLAEYRVQGRGGRGILSMKLSERNGPVVAAKQVSLNDLIMIVTNRGKMIRIRAKDVSEFGRVTQGVRLMDVNLGENVVAVELAADGYNEDESNNQEAPVSTDSESNS